MSTLTSSLFSNSDSLVLPGHVLFRLHDTNDDTGVQAHLIHDQMDYWLRRLYDVDDHTHNDTRYILVSSPTRVREAVAVWSPSPNAPFTFVRNDMTYDLDSQGGKFLLTCELNVGGGFNTSIVSAFITESVQQRYDVEPLTTVYVGTSVVFEWRLTPRWP